MIHHDIRLTDEQATFMSKVWTYFDFYKSVLKQSPDDDDISLYTLQLIGKNMSVTAYCRLTSTNQIINPYDQRSRLVNQSLTEIRQEKSENIFFH